MYKKQPLRPGFRGEQGLFFEKAARRAGRPFLPRTGGRFAPARDKKGGGKGKMPPPAGPASRGAGKALPAREKRRPLLLCREAAGRRGGAQASASAICSTAQRSRS